MISVRTPLCQARELEMFIDPHPSTIDNGSHKVLAWHGRSLFVSLSGPEDPPLTIGHIQRWITRPSAST